MTTRTVLLEAVVSAAAAGRGGSIEERKRGNEKSKKVFLVFELSSFPSFSSSHFLPSPEAEAVLASRYAALLSKKISSVSSYSRS